MPPPARPFRSRVQVLPGPSLLPVPTSFPQLLAGQVTSLKVDRLLLGLGVGHAVRAHGHPVTLAAHNPFPGLLLVPRKGSLRVHAAGELPRAIHPRLWFWCGQHQVFQLGLPAELDLLWFEVPAGLPGFSAPMFRPCMTVFEPSLLLPVLDLMQVCRLECELRKVALFGRSLDLLAHIFQRQIEGEGGGGQDSARVAHARRILLDRLTKPPGIPQLAEMVGLNECKLKALFKATYLRTLHGFVKEERLLRARDLLLSTDLSVSEVAWSVGWENCSHFAHAFRERFGCLPSRLQVEAGSGPPGGGAPPSGGSG